MVLFINTLHRNVYGFSKNSCPYLKYYTKMHKHILLLWSHINIPTRKNQSTNGTTPRTDMKTLAIISIFATVIFLVHIEANHIFTSKIFRELEKSESGNLVFSPFALEVILGLTHEGARGNSAEQLLNLLRLSKHPEDRRAQWKNILQYVDNSTDYKLLLADKIFLSEKFEINKTYAEEAEELFKSEVGHLGFSNTVKAAEEINKWIENKTRNNMHAVEFHAIEPKHLKSDDKAVLINALWFDGILQLYLTPNHANKTQFHLANNKSVEVESVSAVGTVGYSESAELKAKFLRVKYAGKNITFTYVVPDRNLSGSLEFLSSKLEDVYLYSNFSSRFGAYEVPKFRLHRTHELVPILKHLGVTDIFDESKADLRGITGKKQDLFVNNVIQRSVFNVCDRHFETLHPPVIPPLLPIRPLPPLVINQPFLFFVNLNEDEIIYTGKVLNPLEN